MMDIVKATEKGKKHDVTVIQEAYYFFMSRAVAKHNWKLAVESSHTLLNTLKHEPYALAECVNHTAGSCNAGFDRLQALYLQPLHGTQSQLQRHHQRKKSQLSTKDILWHLKKASQVRALADSVQRDPRYPQIVLDSSSTKATMNLWSKRCQFLSQTRDWRAHVDDETINSALGGAVSAKECIQAMINFITKWRKEGPQPGSTEYAILLAAIAHSRDPGAVDRALALVEKFDASVQLSPEMYTSVFLAIRNHSTNHGDNTYVNRAGDLWRDMQHTFPNNKVTASVYMTILSRANQPEKVEEVLNELELAGDENEEHFPSLIHYNIALSAWSFANRPKAAERVGRLLKQLQRRLKPSIISYTAVLDTLVKSPGQVDRAMELLKKLQLSSNTRPDATCYLKVMRSLATRASREQDCKVREALCQKVQEILLLWRQHNSPTLDGYKLTLDAWACSHSMVAGRRAMDILKLVDAEFRAGNSKLLPDIETLEDAMLCLVRSKSSDFALRSADQLRRMAQEYDVKESVPFFRSFLRIVAWHDPFRAERILQKRFNEADEFCFQAIIRGYSNLPDGGATHAQRILDRMTRLYQDEGHLQLKPGDVTYLAVMEAWGKTKGRHPLAMRRVQELMEKTTPTSFAYSTYQQAILRLSPEQAPFLLEEKLQNMQRAYSNGTNPLGKPNAFHFSQVIYAWRVSGADHAAKRADAILKLMLELYARGDKHLKPTVGCYIGVLGAWAQSSDPQASQHALDVLQGMQNAATQDSHEAQPTASCFHEVMLAVVRSSRTDKFDRLYDLLCSMRENDHAEPRARANSYSLVLHECTDSKMANRILREYRHSVVEPQPEVFVSYISVMRILGRPFDTSDWPTAVLKHPRIQQMLKQSTLSNTREDRSTSTNKGES